MHNRYEKIFPGTIAASVLLMLLGIALDDPANILPGLYRIVTMVTGFEDFRFGFYDGSGSHVGLSPNVDDLKKNAQQGGTSL